MTSSRVRRTWAQIAEPLLLKNISAMSPTFSLSHVRNLTDLFADETMLFRGTLDKLANC